jgi:RHS repeat-associated protein
MALLGAILLTLTLLQCSHATDSSHAEPAAQHEDDDDAEDGVVWINELTSADTILINDDLTGSQLAELDGLGRIKSRTSVYPYGFSHYDDSSTTRLYAGSPRDRSVGLDHMGARFYSPEHGIWTSADPAILTSPEQYVTAEFSAANPYAYANLRPVVAADRDGQFWHVVAGAAAGALIGGSLEAARQYVEHGKIESWGRVSAAAGGGGVSGGLTALAPGAGLASLMGLGATSNVAGGMTTRLIESGGKSAGTLDEVATDAVLGAGTGGIVKGGSAVLRKVAPKKPSIPPASKAPVAKVGTSSASSSKGIGFGSNDLALGLNPGGALKKWTMQHGGKTAGEFNTSSGRFPDQIRSAMEQASHIRFNLDGVDVRRASGMLNDMGEPAAGYTNYELHLLKATPQFLEKTTFYQGGVSVSIPF